MNQLRASGNLSNKLVFSFLLLSDVLFNNYSINSIKCDKMNTRGKKKTKQKEKKKKTGLSLYE